MPSPNNFCPQCGATCDPEALFCRSCGISLAPQVVLEKQASTSPRVAPEHVASTNRTKMPWITVGALLLFVVVGIRFALSQLGKSVLLPSGEAKVEMKPYELKLDKPIIWSGFSPDGRLVAVVKQDFKKLSDTDATANTVCEFRVAETGEIERRIPILSLGVRKIKYPGDSKFAPVSASFGGNNLLAISDGHKVKIYDVEEKKFLLFGFDLDFIKAVSLAPSGQYLAIVGFKSNEEGWKVQVYDTKAKQKIQQFDVRFETYSTPGNSNLAFSADSKKIFYSPRAETNIPGGGEHLKLAVSDVATGSTDVIGGQFDIMGFSPLDNDDIIIQTRDKSMCYNVKSEEETFTLQHSVSVPPSTDTALGFSAFHGAKYIVGLRISGGKALHQPGDVSIGLWNPIDGKFIHSIASIEGKSLEIAPSGSPPSLSPNGKFVLYCVGNNPNFVSVAADLSKPKTE